VWRIPPLRMGPGAEGEDRRDVSRTRGGMNRRTTPRRRPASTTTTSSTARSAGSTDPSVEDGDGDGDASEVEGVDVAEIDEADVETADEATDGSDALDGGADEAVDESEEAEVVDEVEEPGAVDEAHQAEVVDEAEPLEEPEVVDEDEWAIDVASRRALEEAGYPDLDEPQGFRPSTPVGRYGPIESVIRRPLITVVSVVVCVAIALVLALAKPVTYTAETQLIVGGIVRPFEPAAGQTDAILELTDIYSRLVGTGAHLERVDGALGTTVPAGSISAAPIPNSALIRLEATAGNAEEAVARANAGAEQLVAEVADLKAQSTAADQELLTQLDAANADLFLKNAAATSAQAALTAAGASATQAQRDAYAAAASAAATAQVKSDVLDANYKASASAKSAGINLTLFSGTGGASNDRNKTILLYGFVGLVVGALIGMALSTLVANRWKLLPDEDLPPSGA